MSRIGFLREKWLVAFAFSWLFFLSYLASGWVLRRMPEPSVLLSFWFIEKMQMALALFTLAGFAESAFLYSEKHRNLFLRITLFLLLPFGSLIYVTLSNSVSQERLKAVDTVSLEGREYAFVYYLMYGDSIYDTGGFAGARLYVLYKCTWGIFCNEIFRQTIKGYIVDPQDPRGLYRPHELYLSTDGRSVIVTDNKRDEVYRCTPHEGDCSLR